MLLFGKYLKKIIKSVEYFEKIQFVVKQRTRDILIIKSDLSNNT